MEEKSKVIKINCNLLDQINKWGNIPEVVKELLISYDANKVTIKQNDNYQFFFCAGDKETPFNVTGVTKPIRVPIEIYNELLKAKIHPEESFSSVLFRLIAFDQKEETKESCQSNLLANPKSEMRDMSLWKDHLIDSAVEAIPRQQYEATLDSEKAAREDTEEHSLTPSLEPTDSANFDDIDEVIDKFIKEVVGETEKTNGGCLDW